MRKLLITTALLTALALPVTATDNTAHIHIHRDLTLRYSTDGVSISFDGKSVCDLATGEDCDLTVTPGHHRLHADVSHWFKADEHAFQPVTLGAGDIANFEAGFSCETWFTAGGPAGGGCAGRLRFEETSREHSENAKGTPGY